MMRSEPLKAAIDVAIAKNIVIFDEQAKPAEITVKLIDLLNSNILYGLYAIVVCETVSIPNEVLLKYRDLAIFRIPESTYRQLYSYYHDTLWGSVAQGDLCLIIGINNIFDFTLGSY